ncbi:MAG TPA: NAD-dependent malic enzyme, partial [Pseudomonadota bacterium]|nr:NAD-dependent malic enzyme [Pseudomonadota bacterium]
MAHYRIDTVLRVRTRHRPGQLARVATVIAQEGALIGEISTLHMAEGLSTREITVETESEEHTERLVSALSRTDGVEIISVRDRVFDCHRGGKLHSKSRVELQHLSDLRYIYTPGVARVSRAIAEKPERAFDYTGLGNSVGIFTNGTRVLGLGDIGPVASLPVMEGKAVLYDRFAGISATPILVDTKDVEEFVQTVVRVSRSFGGIHLEDIRIPECFRIEEELKRRLRKPV